MFIWNTTAITHRKWWCWKSAICWGRHMEAVIAPLFRYSNPIHVYNVNPGSPYNICHTLALLTLIKWCVYISLEAEGSVSVSLNKFFSFPSVHTPMFQSRPPSCLAHHDSPWKKKLPCETTNLNICGGVIARAVDRLELLLYLQLFDSFHRQLRLVGPRWSEYPLISPLLSAVDRL